MSTYLGFNTHGKGRVRVVKVVRHPNGTEDILQFTVQILLEGDSMDEVFLEGDNAKVVATDTCKNTVYCVAHQHNFTTPEEFGLHLCRHFLTQYPSIVNKINVQVIQDNWERLIAPNSKGVMQPHKHTFKRIGPCKRYAHVQGTKRPGSQLVLSVQGGFRNLDILKTTQSGFVGFHRDRYTSLPEDTNRLLGTSVDAEWSYTSGVISMGNVNFMKAFEDIQTALVNTFAGPSDTGVYSKSVQETLYFMGKAALEKVASIDQITLMMPNIHNLAFPLEKYGLENKDRTGTPFIFYPIDEPHGMIKAVVGRGMKARL